MKTNRPTRPGPRTFDNFPDGSVCPICGTNDDGITVLVPIKGTEDDGLVECVPMHLDCAVVKCWYPEIKIGATQPNDGQ